MSEYQMPSVELGDFVYFYPHPGAEPEIAQVIKPGARAVTLWVNAPGFGGMERTSVHHKDDPGFDEYPAWKEYGMWSARPEDPRLAVLSERVAMLEKKLAALQPKK